MILSYYKLLRAAYFESPHGQTNFMFLRRLDGQQITHQIYHELSNVICWTLNYNVEKKEFNYLSSLYFYTALVA